MALVIAQPIYLAMQKLLLLILLLGYTYTSSAQSTPDLIADMCVGDSATITASVSNADSLQWYKNGYPIFGAHKDTLVTYEEGIYFLRAFMGNAKQCFDQSGSISIIINYPKLNDDSYVVPIAKVVVLDVLLNDDPFCAPFDKSSLRIVSPPSIGIVTGVQDGKFVYRPSNTLSGFDKFTYVITDAEGRVTNEATVNVESFVDCALLYPNPVEDMLHVTLNNKRVKLVRLTDMMGKELYRTTADNNNMTIDMSPYAQGMYLVEFAEHDGPGCVVKVQKK